MSIFVEYQVPTEDFALNETLSTEPEAIVEIERVVATEARLTPYFWASGVQSEEFKVATETDTSVDQIEELDQFDEGTLFRAEWTEQIEALIYAYTEVGATVLEASGQDDAWELRMRFDDHASVDQFRSFCQEHDIEYTLLRLYELQEPQDGVQYGLTPKQDEALTTAWEMGYFDEPRRVTMEQIADEFDISQQALATRLKRAHRSLIENTLKISPPDDNFV